MRSADLYPARIEICGGIASGKTTLCNLLAESGWAPVLEDFGANPFWAAFNTSPAEYQFETEITFTLQHYSAVKSRLRERVVCDHAFVQDLAYAIANLTDAQLATFRTVYDHVVSEVKRPALLVHLNCPAEVELQRIRQRARPEEDSIGIEYLQRLNDSIGAAIRDMRDVPIVSIDSGALDFAHNAAVRDSVVKHVLSFAPQIGSAPL